MGKPQKRFVTWQSLDWQFLFTTACGTCKISRGDAQHGRIRAARTAQRVVGEATIALRVLTVRPAALAAPFAPVVLVDRAAALPIGALCKYLILLLERCSIDLTEEDEGNQRDDQSRDLVEDSVHRRSVPLLVRLLESERQGGQTESMESGGESASSRVLAGCSETTVPVLHYLTRRLLPASDPFTLRGWAGTVTAPTWRIQATCRHVQSLGQGTLRAGKQGRTYGTGTYELNRAKGIEESLEQL